MKKQKVVTFLISGGHLTPALAVIDEIRAKNPKNKIVFIGREFAQESEKLKTREQEEIVGRKIPFYAINAAKFHRTYFFRNFQEIIKFIPSFFQIYKIIRLEKPQVFLSFGGYLAFPIAIVCKLMRIPVVTHEQTRTVGLANQVIGQFADKILVSFEDSMRFFPKEKTIHTGNPIRPAVMKYTRLKPTWLTIPVTMPILYITGGSQGSHVINRTVSYSLEPLLKKFMIIHQCGGASNHHYKDELTEVSQKLPKELQQRYFIREWVSDEEVAWIFQHAEIVVSRSGANTVQEIVYSKVPAIFIPLPFAHNDEQTKNAQWLVDFGSAYIISQKDFIPETFIQTVKEAHRKIGTLKKRAQDLRKFHINHAATDIVETCIQLVK